jgi:hypothetical protein
MSHQSLEGPMTDTTRYEKTAMGVEEIRSRRKNLRGRERTLLILVDPSKTADELRASAARIGVPGDFLQTLVRDGYVVAVAGTEGDAALPTPRVVTKDEFGRFRAAKAFMNETAVDALGVRAFMFTLKLERCSTLPDLAKLLPDYAKAIAKGRGEAETRLLVDRAAELLA